MKRLRQFLSERIPIGAAARSFLEKPLPSNVSWLHTLGSALLFLLIVQVLSGGFLLLHYAPTPDHAWDSVNLVSETPSTALLRSLHVWGASFLVVFLTLHLLRVVFHGSYRSPREMNWISGWGIFFIVLAFGFTGHLLPWDRDGYWGSHVGLEMISRIPLIGSFKTRLLMGGEEIGALTLSRFFAMHIFFLPIGLALLVLLHLYLLRSHGPAADPKGTQAPAKTFPFYPAQVFRDAVVAGLVLALLVGVASIWPADLGPRANPSESSSDPRPEWYFLAHYELLRVFPGPDIIPILIIPALLIGLLLALPFLDRGSERHWKARKLPVLGVTLFIALLYGTAAYSLVFDPAGRLTTEEELPLPADGDPLQMKRARRALVRQECTNCHKIQGVGGMQGPDLSQSGWKFNREHLRQQILTPKSHKPDAEMPAYEGKITEQDLEAIVEYLSQML